MKFMWKKNILDLIFQGNTSSFAPEEGGPYTPRYSMKIYVLKIGWKSDVKRNIETKISNYFKIFSFHI